MVQTEKKWQERHYVMAEESERMFSTNTQGYEIDI
jgi:hypothetical protein